VFDVRQIDSMACEKLTFDRRRSLLEMMQFDLTGNVKLIPNFEPSTENLNAMLSQGYEGIMLKRWDGRYRAGHRSRDVLKWKPQPTAEAIITGFKEGEGGRAGNVGALLIRMVDGDVDTSVGCPPFLAAQLQNGKPFNQCQDLLAEWVGKHIEFAHNGIQKTGGPRHPVFRKLRPDRDAVENAWGIR
jgi:bifunctional non-homologous end joining protein LigD